jgi:calpain-15
MTRDMSTLFVKRTIHSNKDRIFPESEFNAFYEYLDGVYEDNTFPPEKKSILGFGVKQDGTFRDNSAQEFDQLAFTWKKASQLMENVNIVVDGISPSDIYQGKLGDCYFLSSISAIAEFPERIERLLSNKTINERGCYGVAMNINGNWN